MFDGSENKFMINEPLTIHSETEKEFKDRPAYALILTFIAKMQIDWVLRWDRLIEELKDILHKIEAEIEFLENIRNKSPDDLIKILNQQNEEKNWLLSRIYESNDCDQDLYRKRNSLISFITNKRLPEGQYFADYFGDVFLKYGPLNTIEGYTTPLTYDIISQATGCSLNTVKNLVKELIGIALIERKQTAIGYLYRVTDEKFVMRAKEIYTQEKGREKCMI